MKLKYLNYDKDWLLLMMEEANDVSKYLLYFLSKGIMNKESEEERYCALVTNNRLMILYYDHETKLFQSGS